MSVYKTIGETEYDFTTKLGLAVSLERKFGMSLARLFEHVAAATIPELISILMLASGNPNNQALDRDIQDYWGYIDLQNGVQEILTRLMFSGTPEEIEVKIEKYPAPEEQKNAIREMLGIPTATPEA
jgi:hypothetical protein